MKTFEVIGGNDVSMEFPVQNLAHVIKLRTSEKNYRYKIIKTKVIQLDSIIYNQILPN